jgi:26S proteasome regulatory subunit N3
MPGRTPERNGNEPVENGINGSQDVDMKDDTQAGKKAVKGKMVKGDDEMTVVVPPSKNQPTPPTADKEGDVVMGESEEAEKVEEKVDPVAETIKRKLCWHQDVGRVANSFITVIKSDFTLLDKAVSLFDARFTLRVLRSISTIRKHLTPEVIETVIIDTYPKNKPWANTLLAQIGKQDTRADGPAAPKSALAKGASPTPEIDVFLGILLQVYYFHKKEYQVGAEWSNVLAQQIQSHNRRTMDSLAARVYFFYSLFAEELAPLPPSPLSPVIALRPTLLAALRTAVLRKDIDTQATVIVLLLRNYLSTSHISQADLLVSHTQFPENASNNQVARYLYYLGRIRAIQLRYTEAHEHLTAATRKAPSSPSAAGFTHIATKLLLVVELLMGDIPDRATFRVASIEKSLAPYLSVVQAVRVGNLGEFESSIKEHAPVFKRDGTYTLILRLRQNVIKTGIRMLSLSYSRISLRDICLRLHLDSEESAEYIVAKAIRDGVIEASLDREHGFMKSKEVGDVYATREPGEAFHDRIRACLALHDESVKVSINMFQHR